jgi:hypothetical protein
MCYNPNPQEMSAETEISGAFGKKLWKGIKKAHTAPLKIAHKITHGKNSPIRKMELALQKGVSKYIPIAKPFIDIHNKVSAQTYKAMEKTGVIKKGDTGLVGGKKAGSPQGAATRLAASVATGKTMVPPNELAALRQSPEFRKQAMRHLVRHAAQGNQTAQSALARISGNVSYG